jgi:hypothetical protein
VVCDLIEPAHLERNEQPFILFLVVASETDAVPVGALRERWHPEAKIKLEKEWADAEQYAKTSGEPACHDALKWLAEHPFEFS